VDVGRTQDLLAKLHQQCTSGESQHTNREESVLPLKVPEGRRLELDSMVNLCECPIIAVISSKLKARVVGLSQKAKQWDQEVEAFLAWANRTAGGEDRPNLSGSHMRNVVSP